MDTQRSESAPTGLVQQKRALLRHYWYAAGVGLTLSADAFAALGTAPNLQGNDYMEQGYGAAEKGSNYLINIVMAAVILAFVVVMWGEWSTFRKEHKLGQFATHGIIGLVLMVVSLFVLNIAKTTMA